MSTQHDRDMARDLPAIALRNAVLDAVDAHRAGSAFDPQFIENCRDQLSRILDDMKEDMAA